MIEGKQYVVKYDMVDGSCLYHSRMLGDFCPRKEYEHATIFNGRRFAEREADKMLQQDDSLVCYHIMEI